MFGDGYVGTGQEGARAFALEKQRDALFKASQQEKDRLRDESAAYRLKGKDDKFASSSNAAEVRLAQETVGLMSKEEFMRRKMQCEAGDAVADPAAPAPAHVPAEEKEKKKKKKSKERASALSFAMDEDEADEGPPISLGGPSKKSKQNPSVGAVHLAARDALSKEEAREPQSRAAAAAVATPLPAGYMCVREVEGGAVELSLEVRTGTYEMRLTSRARPMRSKLTPRASVPTRA